MRYLTTRVLLTLQVPHLFSISEVIRLKHVAKVFIRDVTSSPMSTGEFLIRCPRAVHMLLPCPQIMLMPFAVSEEIRYTHIAQSAITHLTLASDPHLLETFASMNSINGCPEHFATIDSSSNDDSRFMGELLHCMHRKIFCLD